MKIARLFQILAVILVGIAAYFLWLGNRDGVFVCLVLSGCAYFLNMRFQIKERMKARDKTKESEAEPESQKETKE